MKNPRLRYFGILHQSCFALVDQVSTEYHVQPDHPPAFAVNCLPQQNGHPGQQALLLCTESVPTCAEGARDLETVEKEVIFRFLFICRLNELMGKQVDMVRVYSVPTACLHF